MRLMWTRQLVLLDNEERAQKDTSSVDSVSDSPCPEKCEDVTYQKFLQDSKFAEVGLVL